MYKIKLQDINLYINEQQEIKITNYINNNEKDIRIPDNFIIGNKKLKVTKIRGYGFYNNQLTSVVIPKSVERIGRSAFLSNELNSVVIGNSVKIIDDGAFQYNQLTKVSIPDSVERIGYCAFEHNKLTKVTIPKNCEIHPEAFDEDVIIIRRK